jgi:hypothetical protein
MIILSVTHFGFHLNYKWVLVTDGFTCGIVIFLWMLLIVVRLYIFENVIITAEVPVGPDLQGATNS